MSLTDCICCPKHHQRIAVAWADPLTGSPCFHTYSDLLKAADELTRAISGLVSSPPAPVAVYGSNCPHVLAAILALMSLPAVDLEVGGAGGVALLPLSSSQLASEQEKVLTWCGVGLVLVEISSLEVCMVHRCR